MHLNFINFSYNKVFVRSCILSMYVKVTQNLSMGNTNDLNAPGLCSKSKTIRIIK